MLRKRSVASIMGLDSGDRSLQLKGPPLVILTVFSILKSLTTFG